MFNHLRTRGFALALALVGVFCLGFAVPALADDAATVYDPAYSMLTKVIDAPAGTDASGDSYVFHFAGGGTVTESGDDLISDGVVQDSKTLKTDDVVPTIPDVTLKGFTFTDDNTLSNGQLSQAVVQKSINDILTDYNVNFPHAGVYTYEVTEKSATTVLTDGTYINPSQAKYKLRIRVVNTNKGIDSVSGGRDLTINEVTVEQMKDDNGNEKKGKVDPTYPKAAQSKITEVSSGVSPDADSTPLAGDERGRFVEGFTFANEYIKGGSFTVKKLYDGDHSDRTKYSLVELAVYSEAAKNPDANGACLTYLIEGDGIDMTENNQDSDGERRKLNGVKQDIAQNSHYMATFKDNGWAYVRAYLKEDSVIRITGEFGPYNAAYEDQNEYGNRRMVLSTNGLLNGQEYYVIEREPGNYEPTGYVYIGTDDADPRVSSNGMDTTPKLNNNMTDPTDPIPDNQPSYTQLTIPEGALCVNGSATGSATTVFVVNSIDETKVSATGILIDNLPYILMVGIPVAVFAVMFVNKRRANAEA